jgi:hypothetical protein
MKTQIECPLLNLVQALNELTDTDQEVVTLAASLVNSGRVRLCGTFAGAKIKLSQPVVSIFTVAQKRRNKYEKHRVEVSDASVAAGRKHRSGLGKRVIRGGSAASIHQGFGSLEVLPSRQGPQ